MERDEAGDGRNPFHFMGLLHPQLGRRGSLGAKCNLGVALNDLVDVSLGECPRKAVRCESGVST